MKAGPPPFELVGVVVGSGNKIVLLRSRSTKEVFRLREGEQKEGWSVETVTLRSASMVRQGRTEALEFPSSQPGGAEESQLGASGGGRDEMGGSHDLIAAGVGPKPKLNHEY